MNPDSFMPYFGNEFEAAMKGYPAQVKWSYLSACWHYWHHTHCQGLPNDDEYLRNVCECELQQWARVRGVLFRGEPFFYQIDGKWHQKGCNDRYDEARTAYLNKVRGAAKAREKAENKSDTNPDNKADTASDAPLQQKQKGSLSFPVEFPPGFPKTETEAKSHAGFVGCDTEFVATVWNKAAGRGGRDSKDIEIRNWRHYLAAEWAYERERRAVNKKQAPAGRKMTSQELVREAQG